MINTTDTGEESNKVLVTCAKTWGIDAVKKNYLNIYTIISNIFKWAECSSERFTKTISRNRKYADKEAKKEIDWPKIKLNELVYGCFVTSEIRNRLLFGERLIS